MSGCLDGRIPTVQQPLPVSDVTAGAKPRDDGSDHPAPEGAAEGRSPPGSSSAPFAGAPENANPQLSSPSTLNKSVLSIAAVRHVEDDHMIGTLTPSLHRSDCCRTLPALFLDITYSGSVRVDSAGQPEPMSEALRRLATRLMAHPNGDFTPSQPPALLGKLTDHLLVVASDAVRAAAAEKVPQPSGRATLRLLAWVVADTRGAVQPLEKALAETVGKRLEKQAQRVRDTYAAASEHAMESRTAVRAAAVADASPGVDLAGQLAAIDGEERRVFEHHRREVYVGFVELEELLPPRPVSDGGAAASRDPVAAAPAAGITAMPAIAGVEAPVPDVAAQYDLACKLHEELVTTREQLRKTEDELWEARDGAQNARWEAEDRDQPVVSMLQRALGSAAAQLRAARKRLLDPDVDNYYLEGLFQDRSFIDRNDWLSHRVQLREDRDSEECEHPTEVYEDLAQESMAELQQRARDRDRSRV